MSNNRECADYFRQQPGYDRIFKKMREKWKSYGRSAGKIWLRNATESERRALEGILGKSLLESDIHFTLTEFEESLQKTRFAPVMLKELLEEYFGEELFTNKEHTAKQQNKKELFFRQLENDCRQQQLEESVARWIQESRENQKWGYSILVSEWNKQERNALILGRNVQRAFDLILKREEEIPLAVLAAEVTNNPHYFDRGTVAGNLLVHAFCFMEKCDFPQNAYAWRQLLAAAGVEPDHFSNTVIAYGIGLETENGMHPAYEAFKQLDEAYTITSYNLKRITGAYSEKRIVYVVENEMVFSYLLDHLQEKNVSMLCTSGQLHTAALELIHLLVQSGSRIIYSGDLDPEGMIIADKLWQKYPRNVVLWRMSPEDYQKSRSEEDIEKRRLEMLKSIENPLLKSTAIELERVKKAGYQENLLKELVEDIV